MSLASIEDGLVLRFEVVDKLNFVFCSLEIYYLLAIDVDCESFFNIVGIGAQNSIISHLAE